MRWVPSDLLSLASIIEGHNLREVRERKDFATWGVDFVPGTMPSILWVGEQSTDFTPDCWPFMAAHEALHSISTVYGELTDYQFLLFNICEDWRINQCLMGMFEEMRKSYEPTRQVILQRWQRKPLALKSPVSQALQHICYLNHMYTPRQQMPAAANDYLSEILWLRDLFGQQGNWPLVPNDSDRQALNTAKCTELLAFVQRKQTPRDVNIGEIRKLISRFGYDLSFKPRLDVIKTSERKAEVAPTEVGQQQLSE